MQTTFYTYDKLSFTYTEKELEDVIDSILVDYDDETFSFKSLCDGIMSKAIAEDRFKKKANTVYLSNELNELEYNRISLVLWKKIWNHELCLSFQTEVTKSKDYWFIKINHNEKKS